MWKSRAAAVVALLTLPLGLAACGGSTSAATSSSATSSTTQTSSSTTTSSSTQPTSSSTTSSSTSTSSSASSPADNRGKPDKKTASTGLAKILKTTRVGSTFTSAQADKIAACVVDRAYDNLTPKTLNAMATGDSKSAPDNSDGPVFTASVAYCAAAAGVPISPSPTS